MRKTNIWTNLGQLILLPLIILFTINIVEVNAEEVKPTTAEPETSIINSCRLFKVSDATPQCLNAGTGVFFQRDDCSDAHRAWQAEDLYLELDDAGGNAYLRGKVSSGGQIANVDITFTQRIQSGATIWNSTCYTSNLGQIFMYYTTYSGTISYDAQNYTIEPRGGTNPICAINASNDQNGSQIGFAGWSGGSFGGCTEFFFNMAQVNPGETCDDQNNATVDDVLGADGCSCAGVSGGSIGDKVFEDINANGVQDAGEPGIEGVMVKLFDENGNAIQQVRTDANGAYLFTRVPSGRYRVMFEALANYDRSPVNLGSYGTDSDAYFNGFTDEINLAVNQNIISVDAGYTVKCDLTPNINNLTCTSATTFEATLNISNGLCDNAAPVGTTVTYHAVSSNSIPAYFYGGGIQVQYDLENGNYDPLGDFELPWNFTNTTTISKYRDLDNPAPNFTDSDDVFNKMDADRNGSGVVYMAEWAWSPLRNLIPKGWEIVDAAFPIVAYYSGGDLPITLLNTTQDWVNGDQYRVKFNASLGDWRFNGHTFTLRKTSAFGCNGFSVLYNGNVVGNASYGTPFILRNLPVGSVTKVTIQDNDCPNCTQEVLIDGSGINCDPSNGSLGDRVFLDTNKNGIQDAGEQGVNGIVVKLLDGNGSVITQTTTNNGGYYLFSGLAAGMYKVMVNVPQGYTVSPANQGGNDDTDSDININGMTGMITLNQSQNITNVDAGIYLTDPGTAALGNFVWNDIDRDGYQDANEPGLADVVVKLLSSTGTLLAETTSDANGFYQFTGLDAGQYKVMFMAPNGFAQSPAKTGNDDNRDSDQLTTGMTNIVTLNQGQVNNQVDAGFYFDNTTNCQINAQASNIQCTDNGTPNNPDDDTYTYDLTIAGGTGWGYNLNGQDVYVAGFSSTIVQMGPYAISSNPTNTAYIADFDNPTCTNQVTVNAPNTCSGNTGGGGTDCSDITISGEGSALTLGNLMGQVVSIQVFNSSWAQVYKCFGDCTKPETVISNLAAGTYFLKIAYYTNDYQLVCDGEGYYDVVAGGGNGIVDVDGDGVPASEDCNDNDASVPTAPGTACNDGNSNTTNDVIQSDGCSCAGTAIGGGTGDCSSITISGAGNALTISNLSAPVVSIQVFNSSWGQAYKCFGDCATPETVISNLDAGKYFVKIAYYNANYTLICDMENYYDVVAGGGTVIVDVDGDGVPASEDCNDNDASVPTAPGTACNDGNSNTTNDVIQSDGCSCAGTAIGGGSGDCSTISISGAGNALTISNLNAPVISIQVFDANWGQAFKCFGDCTTPQTVIGNLQAGKYYVKVAYYSASYNLICDADGYYDVVSGGGGTGVIDVDGDGVPASEDCDDNNPNLPVQAGSACDDNNPNTTNDVIQSDGCTCAGTPVTGGGSGDPMDCDNVAVTTGSASMTISGLTAPVVSIQVFDSAWGSAYSCFGDCDKPSQVIDGLSAGTYFVKVGFYNASWQYVCEDATYQTVGGNSNYTTPQGRINTLDIAPTAVNAALTWANNTGKTNDYFEVQRSVNGGNFTVIGQVENAAKSENVKVYTFVDGLPQSGENVYRVIARQLNGEGYNTNEVSATFDAVEFNTIYPNPANDLVNVSLRQFVGQDVNLYVMDNLGRRAQLVQVEDVDGTPVTIDLNGYNQGQYIIFVQAEDGTSDQFKLIIAR